MGRWLALWALLIGPGAQLLAEEVDPRGIGAMADPLSLHLEGDGPVRLAGIYVPTAQASEARDALRRRLERTGDRLSTSGGVTADRYGRKIAEVASAARGDLALMLVSRGLAVVQPAVGSASDHQALLDAEEQARRAGLGLWSLPDRPVASADAADRLQGRYGIVEGRVMEVGSTEHHIYLNFGPDWRRDFTIRIRRPELDHVVGRWVGDAQDLVGRQIRARGLVISSGGPLIEASHPGQIEVSS